MKKKPLVIIILDGWGYSEKQDNNAIHKAKTPNWDQLWDQYPHTLLNASGAAVGLPDKQMGNSEVGHITIGAGRTALQSLERINQAIKNKIFFQNKILSLACDQAATNLNNTLHIIGLLSPGGVHSHEQHIFAMLELAVQKKVRNIVVHPILDGRDTPPKSAEQSLIKLNNICEKYNNISVGSICGRTYAMDRDNNYDRTKLYYDLLTNIPVKDEKNIYPDSITALHAAYARSETDEFVKPSVIKNANKNYNIQNKDIVIFMNFRADRARQLSYCLTTDKISSNYPKLKNFVTMTEYAKDIKSSIAFDKHNLTNTIGEILQNNNLSQLRIAETEKYAHVTFFLNGGKETMFKNEDRILIPSPKVSTYDVAPEMSAIELTEILIKNIEKQKYHVIFCNFANADMVGHTGNIESAITAVETIDHCLGKIISVLKKLDGELLITADHGNVEQMVDPDSHQPHTAHTNNLVPCIYVGNKKINLYKTNNGLQDLAPTMLALLNIKKPTEMTGKSLIEQRKK